MKEFRRILIGYFLLLLFRVCSLFPLPLLGRFGRGMGSIAWRSNSSAAKVTRVNLNLCSNALQIAPDNIEKLVKKSLKSDFQTLAESGYIWHHSWKKLESTIKNIEGFELLQKKIQSDRGLLLLAPHLGTWEVFASFIGQFTTVYSLYKPAKYPPLDNFMKRRRESTGMVMLPINRTGVRSLLKQLNSGGTALILPDQEPKKGAGIFTSLFDVEALTPSLPIRLIQKTKCDVLSVCVLRCQSTHSFSIQIKEADPGIFDSDTKTAVRALNKTIEQIITLAPLQYTWSYKRFKYNSRGKTGMYSSTTQGK